MELPDGQQLHETLMLFAAQGGNAAVVGYMARRWRGSVEMALYRSSRYGDVHVVQVLLEAVNVSHECLNTHWDFAIEEAAGLAAANGHLPLVELLLDETADRYGEPPDWALLRIYDEALEHGHPEVGQGRSICLWCERFF
jgi:hypothetical protein